NAIDPTGESMWAALYTPMRVGGGLAPYRSLQGMLRVACAPGRSSSTRAGLLCAAGLSQAMSY
ncbi:MAG: hypothetical protein KFF50_11095, partial [Desulfatitalea sp.]|nr:hypothetical protein [Desulfatitalea sp.]